MSRRIRGQLFPALFLAVSAVTQVAAGADSSSAGGLGASSVDLFDARDAGHIDMKFIAMSDRRARLLITNKTDQPIHLQLPEAFAGVPVLAQFGGGGGGRAGGGFGGGGRAGGGGGTGGGQQAVGGGFGGGGGGLGGGGGGGFFSVPPEKTAKLNVPVVCLDHGLENPQSTNPYTIVPATDHLEGRPAVVELLKAFGRGELQHGATQAAAWHLNSDMTWNELAAKLQGTRRSPRRPPYFSREEIQAGLAYANEAVRLAQLNAQEYERLKAERSERQADNSSEKSEALSTTEEEAAEPATETQSK